MVFASEHLLSVAYISEDFMNKTKKTTMEKVLERHAAMVLDPFRTSAIRQAIDQNVGKSDVVVDVGSGIGLLSFFACRAGAKHVYAIDCDIESVQVAKTLAKRFGYEKQITFVEEISFLAKIDKKADVLICETVGSLAFDENILATMFDAKERLLKPGGKTIPSKLELWGALSDNRSAHSLYCDVEGLDIAPSEEKEVPTHPILVSPSNFLSKPFLIGTVDFNNISSNSLKTTVKIKTIHDGICSCIAVWPKITWAEGYITDCSPFSPPTHWKQSLLEVEPSQVNSGEKHRLEFIAGPHPEDNWLQTETLWKLEKTVL